MDDSGFFNLLSSPGKCENPNVEEDSPTIQNLISLFVSNSENAKSQPLPPPPSPAVISSTYRKVEKTNSAQYPKLQANLFNSVRPYTTNAGEIE